jgi:hypothetical protein
MARSEGSNRTSLRQPFLDEMAAVFAEVKTVLDERQRRLLLGAVAQRVGRGGSSRSLRRSGLTGARSLGV